MPHATPAQVTAFNHERAAEEKRGLIPYFKLGKAVRFRVADVAAALERMRIG